MVSAIEKQVLQSQVMERIQQVQQQHPDMQQQYFKIQLGEERRKLKKRVNESDQVHPMAVDGEEERKRRKVIPREEASPEPLREETSEGPKPQDHIDIKV